MHAARNVSGYGERLIISTAPRAVIVLTWDDMDITCQIRKADCNKWTFSYFVFTWLTIVCLLDRIFSAGWFLWYFALSEPIIP